MDSELKKFMQQAPTTRDLPKVQGAPASNFQFRFAPGADGKVHFAFWTKEMFEKKLPPLYVGTVDDPQTALQMLFSSMKQTGDI